MDKVVLWLEQFSLNYPEDRFHQITILIELYLVERTQDFPENVARRGSTEGGPAHLASGDDVTNVCAKRYGTRQSWRGWKWSIYSLDNDFIRDDIHDWSHKAWEFWIR